jgi:hypothetical protein
LTLRASEHTQQQQQQQQRQQQQRQQQQQQQQQHHRPHGHLCEFHLHHGAEAIECPRNEFGGEINKVCVQNEDTTQFVIPVLQLPKNLLHDGNVCVQLKGEGESNTKHQNKTNPSQLRERERERESTSICPGQSKMR